jgi:sugar/nucleoside kinase (ribokinase family)
LYGLLQNKSLEWSADFANNVAAASLADFGLHWLKNFDKEAFK